MCPTLRSSLRNFRRTSKSLFPFFIVYGRFYMIPGYCYSYRIIVHDNDIAVVRLRRARRYIGGGGLSFFYRQINDGDLSHHERTIIILSAGHNHLYILSWTDDYDIFIVVLLANDPLSPLSPYTPPTTPQIYLSSALSLPSSSLYNYYCTPVRFIRTLSSTAVRTFCVRR